jgi:hypothetical protein
MAPKNFENYIQHLFDARFLILMSLMLVMLVLTPFLDDFSFISITTLGHGDITPVTDKATALALIEAVVGQIYMVVLVAWLVGMHVF